MRAMQSLAEDKRVLPLPKTQDPRGSYRNDIDGLRAIAVTAVVLYHAGVSMFSGGFIGVDVFFVISGYLIGAHIYRDVRSRQFSLARFYRLRAKRILPALFAVLLFCYVVSFFLLSPPEMAKFGEYAVSSVLSLTNVVANRRFNYFNPFAMQVPLLMTWSLGVEEQFYIFFPLLMLLLARFARSRGRNGEQTRKFLFWIVLAVAVLSCLLSVMATLRLHIAGASHLWFLAAGPSDAFYQLPYRAWELAAGVLMALYEARANGDAKAAGLYGGSRLSGWRAVAGAAAIFFSIFRYGPSTIFPGQGAILPVIGAVLVLSAPEAWWNRKILSSKPFRWIGLVSYSWYLWHWPLMSFPSIVADKPLATRTLLLFALAALGCAWLSYRTIEQPFRKSTVAPAPLLFRYGVACLVLALPGLFMIWTHGFSSRYPELVENGRVLSAVEHSCFGQESPLATNECLPPPDGRPAIALIGDSHALVIGPEMRVLANAAGMRLLSMSHAACPPLIGVTPNEPGTAFDPSCQVFYDAALKLSANDPTVQTVVLAGQWAMPAIYGPAGYGYVPFGHRRLVNPAQSDANLAQGLEAMVSALKRARKRVVLLQDVYSLKFDPQRRLAANEIPARRWLGQLLQGQYATLRVIPGNEMFSRENAAAAAVVARVASREGVEIFDLRSHLCRDASCTLYANGHLFYHDMNHVSQEGAERALQGFPIVPSPES